MLGFEPSGLVMVPETEAPRHPRNYTWADLMKRVYSMDVLQCGRCGGKLKVIAAIYPPEATTKILNSLGLPSRSPPVSPAIQAGPTFDFDPA